MLFGRLLSREGNFFEMLNQHPDHIVEAAHAFPRVVANCSKRSMMPSVLQIV